MNLEKLNLFLGTVLITAIIVGGVVYYWQQAQVEAWRSEAVNMIAESQEDEVAPIVEEVKKSVNKIDGPIVYDLGDLPVSVSLSNKVFDYADSILMAMAEECGTELTRIEVESLVSKMKGANASVYSFTYTEPSQFSVFKVTLYPNLAGLSDQEEFERFFDICAVGGEAYPFTMNEDWLVFVSSCGSGYDDDSGRLHGCTLIKDAFEATFSF